MRALSPYERLQKVFAAAPKGTMPPLVAGPENLPRPAVPRAIDELRDACAGDDRALYALLDAARLPGLKKILESLHYEFASLYAGQGKPDLSHCAPYLVRFGLRDESLAWLDQSRDLLTTAVFVVTPVGFAELRGHFRRFLLVTDTRRRALYFRFYDPRVLGPFLAASTEGERALFFGPIRRFLARDESDPPVSASRALRAFAAPEGFRAAETMPRPDARARFALTAAHEAALSRDTLARYERRAVAYLRERFPEELGDESEAVVLAHVRRARALAPDLLLTAGRDVTILAEVLVMADPKIVQPTLAKHRAEDRPRHLLALRDRLCAQRRTPS